MHVFYKYRFLLHIERHYMIKNNFNLKSNNKHLFNLTFFSTFEVVVSTKGMSSLYTSPVITLDIGTCDFCNEHNVKSIALVAIQIYVECCYTYYMSLN